MSSTQNYSFAWQVDDPVPLTTDYRLDKDDKKRPVAKHPIDDNENVAARNVFLSLVRDSREICSHCFSKIRSVSAYSDTVNSEWKKSKREYLATAEDAKAVELGSVGYDNYRTARRQEFRSDTDTDDAYRRAHYLDHHDEDGSIIEDNSANTRVGILVPTDGSYEPRVCCERCGWIGTRMQNTDKKLSNMVESVYRLCRALSHGTRQWHCDDAPNGYVVDVDTNALRTQIGRLKSADGNDLRDTEIFVTAIARTVSLAPRPPRSDPLGWGDIGELLAYLDS